MTRDKRSIINEWDRLQSLLWLMLLKYQPNCYFCNKPFTLDDLPNKGVDLLTEHHVDGNHYNDKLSNRVIAHRVCHKRYHVKDNINKKKLDINCVDCKQNKELCPICTDGDMKLIT